MIYGVILLILSLYAPGGLMDVLKRFLRGRYRRRLFSKSRMSLKDSVV